MASKLQMRPLPLPVLGMDVVSQENALPEDAVRRAANVVIDDTGRPRRRPGHRLLVELENTHSFWRGNGKALVAADRTLYRFDHDAGTVTPIFVGLPRNEWIEFSVLATDVYFSAPGVLGKITDDWLVRSPGVAPMLGNMPILTATVGGLLPGSYGVAYSLVNDLGEESGLSSPAWINLPVGGGILLSGLLTSFDVARMKIYVTQANGDALYLNANLIAAATTTITDQTTSAKAQNHGLDPMPGGSFVRHYKGRTVVALDDALIFSESFNYGLRDVRRPSTPFGHTITMLEPVESGMFVGTAARVFFLAGDVHSAKPTVVSTHGAAAHSGRSVAADYFNGELVPERDKPVAAWQSDAGMVVGRADGSVVHAQEKRIRMSSAPARPVFMQHNGIKQAAFITQSIAFNGAMDTTL